MLVAMNFELTYILNQIAEANEKIEDAKATLATEATRNTNYKGTWAATNRARRRNRITNANHIIAENEVLVEGLQRKVDVMVEKQATNIVNAPATMEAVEEDIKNDAELLAFLLG